MTGSTMVALDIGNTTVSLGCFEGERLVSSDRIPAARAGDLADLWPEAFPPLAELASVALVGCSVNPQVLGRVEGALAVHGGRLQLVERDLDIDIEARVREPATVGADRLVNAREAYRRAGGPVMVVDFGTAVTLDCVSADGAYVGGAIAPGVRLGAAALHEHTALLPSIGLVDDPPALAADTVSAMQSGVFWGTVGGVRELVRRLLAEQPPGTAVLATGGDAALFAPHVPEIQSVVPDLTLAGLSRIYRDAQAG